MTIVTLFHAKFNRFKTKLIHGPCKIPEWHPLFGKKCWRCGWYKRNLILYDQTIITIVVYRFYCPETKKTYSLLPFFVKRYERHINTTIEEIIKAYFLTKTSVEELATEPRPSPRTIRRWLSRFRENLNDLRQMVEEYLIRNVPQYLPTAAWHSTMKEQLTDLLNKTDQLPIIDKDPPLYGSLSYLNYAAAIQNPAWD
jgi:hypothetical protein